MSPSLEKMQTSKDDVSGWHVQGFSSPFLYFWNVLNMHGFLRTKILTQAFNLYSAETTEWTFWLENTWKHVILLIVLVLVLTVLAVFTNPPGTGHWAGFTGSFPLVFKAVLWSQVLLFSRLRSTLAHQQMADSLGRNTTPDHPQSSPPNHCARMPSAKHWKFSSLVTQRK